MNLRQKVKNLTIGKIAKASGVNIDTIRYYERRDLIKPAQRSPSGYRLYSADSIRRVRFIKRAQGLGFTLTEIAQLLAFGTSPEATARDVLEMTEAKIREEQAKIEHLHQIQTALMKVAQDCPGEGPVKDCPIFRYFEADD